MNSNGEKNIVKIVCNNKIIFPHKNDFLKILNRIQDMFFPKKSLFVDVLLTDDEKIISIAEEYGKKTRSIDVISFPLFDKDDLFNLNVYQINLGQIIFSYEQVRANARRFGHTYRREFCYLFVHSLLHLLSFDHVKNDEEIIMNDLSEKIMHDLKITRTRCRYGE